MHKVTERNAEDRVAERIHRIRGESHLLFKPLSGAGPRSSLVICWGNKMKTFFAILAAWAVYLGCGGQAPAFAQWSDFRVEHSGKCLDATTRDNGAKVVQHECHGQNNQQWKFDGLRLIEKESNHCLQANGVENLSPITANNCTGAANQQWSFKDGKLQGLESGKCLDVAYASKENAAGLIIWTCSNGTNQRWRASYTQNLSIDQSPDAKWAEVRLLLSGKCLDATTANNDAKVVQHECSGGPNQQWWRIDGIYGDEIVVKQSKRCLTTGLALPDVEGANEVIVRNCEWGRRDQTWKTLSDGRIIDYTGTRCLAIFAGSKDNQARAIVENCSGPFSQMFEVGFGKKKNSYATIRLKNKREMCVAAQHSAGANPPPVFLKKCDATDSIFWMHDGKGIFNKGKQEYLAVANHTRTEAITTPADGEGAGEYIRAIAGFDVDEKDRLFARDGICLQARGNTDGSGLYKGYCASDRHMYWDAGFKENQWGEFKVKSTGMCLDAISREAGASVVQMPCNGADNQKWRFDGRRLVVKSTGYCLDTTTKDNGAKLSAQVCHERENQMWLARNGGWLQNGDGKCAVVVGGSKKVGAQIVAVGCSNDPIGQWDSRLRTEEKWLRIDAIRVVAPSNGISDTARTMAEVGGVAVGSLISEGVPYGLGDVIVMAVEIGGSVATREQQDSGSLGVKLLQAIDSVTAGDDDFYLKVNGRKAFPMIGSDVRLGAGDWEHPSFSVPLVRPVTIELMERDSGDDDLLGAFTFQPTFPVEKKKSLLIGSKEHESMYLITYTIGSSFLDPDD